MGWLRENAKELLDKMLSQASLSIANACGEYSRGGKEVGKETQVRRREKQPAKKMDGGKVNWLLSFTKDC